MHKILLRVVFLALIFSCTNNSEKTELAGGKKTALIVELKQMLEKDQLNRQFLSYGTFDKKMIDSLNKLSIEEVIKYRQKHITLITSKQQDSLRKLQSEIDLYNTDRLYSIIEEYGWLNKTKLDSMVDPMVFLFHTPLETIEKMQKILLEEVKAKRMQPIKYATYIDNMRKKAYGKNQLYGTGQEFDPSTNSIVPPLIDDIDSTNQERKKIGLSELKVGEYRISSIEAPND